MTSYPRPLHETPRQSRPYHSTGRQLIQHLTNTVSIRRAWRRFKQLVSRDVWTDADPRREGLAPGGGEGEDQRAVRVQGAMVKVGEVATPRVVLAASRATTMTEQEEERRAGTVQE